MSNTKLHVISFLQTFGATILAAIGATLSQVPVETLTTLEFWKGGAFVALIVAAVRSAVKLVWERYAPVTFGGKK